MYIGVSLHNNIPSFVIIGTYNYDLERIIVILIRYIMRKIKHTGESR